MRVYISNEIEIEDYTSKVYEWCVNNLVVTNPTYDTLLRMGKEDIIKRTHVSKKLKLFTRSGNSLILPFGCLYGIWPLIKNSQIETSFNSCNDLSFKNHECPWELYDYQQDAITAALQAKGGVLSAGCGAGKTTMGIELIHKIGKKALWLTHTKDLLKQAAKDMKNLYPSADIGYITDGKIDIGKDITVATVQTLEKINPKYYSEEFETVVVDECFPIGTKISTKNGYKNIEDIKVGDIVLSFNHQKNDFEYKKVNRLFVKTSNNLCILKTNDNILVATKNHPIYTQRGYVAMEELKNGDYVLQEVQERNYEGNNNEIEVGSCKSERIYLLQPTMCSCLPKKTNLDGGKKKKNGRENAYSKRNSSSFCRKSKENEGKQSHDLQRGCFKNDGNKREEWNVTPTNKKSRWKWKSFSLAKIVKRRINKTWISNTDGVCCEDSSNRRTKTLLPNLLQDRYSDTIVNAGNRSRWEISSWKKSKRKRSKENKIFEWKRVESVQSYEQANKERCEGSCTVYNFEVEGNHNYFANDILVHNCHHASGAPTFAKMFQKVLSNLKCRYKFGLSATPFRNDSLGRTIYTNLGMNMLGKFEPIYTVSRDLTNTLTAEHVRIDVETPFSYDTLNTDGTMDYNCLIDYLSENELRNEAIINKVMECSQEGRKQALLCLRVAHCELLYEKLKEKGLRVELIAGKTAAKKREQALNETDNWDVIISTISLFKEGINIKALDSVHLCSPAKDKSAIIQACGRCERVLEGKKEPKFFDYVDVNFPYCLGAYKKRKSYLKNR